MRRRAAPCRRWRPPRFEPRAGRPASFPLSDVQRRLWEAERRGGGAPHVSVEALRLRGPLDRHALAWAFGAIATRHEVLRTRFVEIDGVPAQVVLADGRVAFSIDPLDRVPDGARSGYIEAAVHAAADEAFDLSCDPLMRVRLLPFAPNDCALVTTAHDAIFDLRSAAILHRELSRLYTAYGDRGEQPLPPLRAQYGEFAMWAQDCVDPRRCPPRVRGDMSLPSGWLPLPTDRPRAQGKHAVAEVIRTHVSRNRMAALQACGRAFGVPISTTLIAALSVLLTRYIGDEYIVIGRRIDCRHRSLWRESIGHFEAALPLSVHARPRLSFGEILQQIRQEALRLHADERASPGRDLAGDGRSAAAAARLPFAVTFGLASGRWERPILPDVGVEVFHPTASCVADTDLDVRAWIDDEKLVLSWTYDSDLFDRWHIQQMARHYDRILAAVVAGPGQPVGTLGLARAPACRIPAPPRSRRVGSADCSVTAVFERRAASVPDAIAVSCGDEYLTYSALNQAANRLAHALIAKAIGPESVVGVIVERSPNVPVTLLAVWKAGAIYLPLDPTYPAARLTYMVRDAGASCVLTSDDADVKEGRPAGPPRHLIYAADATVPDLLVPGSPRNPEVAWPAGSDRGAYLMYTSGSTGRPNGVVATHRAVMNVVQHMVRAWKLQRTDVVMALSSCAVDFSLLELAGAWAVGATTRVAEPAELTNPTRVVAQLDGVTVLHALPGVLREAARATRRAVGWWPHLRVVSTGGDFIPPDLLRSVRATFPVAMLDVNYGPTEATIVCANELPADRYLGQSGAMGRPIANTRLHLLDHRMNPVPAGVIGELYIAGCGLARGYWNNPGRTADRFVANPFDGPGERLYRTGDLARREPDGTLYFVGRSDDQVKVGGFRVELAEIEAALRLQPGVRDAVVSCSARPGEDRRLIAYVVAVPPMPLDGRYLHRQLASSLPSYMLPDSVITLDDLPMLPNAKVDRRALRLPETAAPTREATLQLVRNGVERPPKGVPA